MHAVDGGDADGCACGDEAGFGEAFDAFAFDFAEAAGLEVGEGFALEADEVCAVGGGVGACDALLGVHAGFFAAEHEEVDHGALRPVVKTDDEHDGDKCDDDDGGGEAEAGIDLEHEDGAGDEADSGTDAQKARGGEDLLEDEEDDAQAQEGDAEDEHEV